IEIKNSTEFYNQDSILDVFLSKVVIEDSIIRDLTITETCIKIAASELNIMGTNMTNISNPDSYDFLLVSYDSSLTIKNTQFKSSNSIFFRARNAIVIVDGIEFDNITSHTSLFRVDDSHGVSIGNITATSSTTQ